MSSLWLRDGQVFLKSYTAAVKGPKSIVKIELEITEPGALGYLLTDLGEIQKEQKAAQVVDRAAAQAPRRPRAVALEQKPLMLTHRRPSE